MPIAPGQPPKEWQNYSTRFPIPAVRLRRGDLKRLYGLIDDKVADYRDRVISTQLSQLDGESTDDFAARRQRIFDAFVTSVSVTSISGEVVHFNKHSAFDTSDIPDRIRSVFISTIPVHQAVLKFAPVCSVVVFLDFSRPPLLDLARLPTLPTQNESNFEITADLETWFTATRSKLLSFFEDRKTAANWLHSAGIYDITLFILGVPFAIRLAYRLGELCRVEVLPGAIQVTFYVYVFLLSILFFRLGFSYSRWVFPKVEIDADDRSSNLKHRGVWLAVFVGVLSSLLYDILKKGI